MMQAIRRSGMAVLVVALGFAVSPVFGAMMEGAMTAMLVGAGNHNAAGKVVVAKNRDGNSILTITEINVDRVPDGRVYLARDGDYAKGVELGKLTQFSGTVEYPIPVGINTQDYNSVVIWCKKFSVEIGHAFFEKKMMK